MKRRSRLLALFLSGVLLLGSVSTVGFAEEMIESVEETAGLTEGLTGSAEEVPGLLEEAAGTQGDVAAAATESAGESGWTDDLIEDPDGALEEPVFETEQTETASGEENGTESGTMPQEPGPAGDDGLLEDVTQETQPAEYVPEETEYEETQPTEDAPEGTEYEEPQPSGNIPEETETEEIQQSETLPEETSGETEEENPDILLEEEPESEALTEELTEDLLETESELLDEENRGADQVSGDWRYTVSGSYATITGYSGTSTSLTLPTSLGGKTVTAIRYGAFANNTKLRSVTIPSVITSIGHQSSYVTGAFEGCKNLAAVTLQAGSGSAYIGLNTFKNCVSLQSIVVPGNYTAIKANAFNGCTSLTRMEYKASSSGYANQQINENAFNGCSSLATVIIPKTVSTIDKGAFMNCEDLTSLTLNEGLRSIGYGAFSGCIKLRSVIIPSTVTSIGHASSYVTGAFEGCSRLETVTLRAGSEEAYIGLHTFKNCVSLQSILIPGNYKAVKANAFNGCTALKRMEYRASTSSYADQQINENAFYNCSSLVIAIIPKTVSTIDKEAFRNCTNLTSLTLNEGLKNIGYGAFAGCIKLQTVAIPSTVTSIGHVSSYVTGAFEGCSKLATVTLRAGEDESYIGLYTFKNCVSLKSILIPGNYKAVKASAFSGCSALTRMEYRASTSSYANQQINENAFYNCSSLATVIIPKTVSTIDKEAFRNCTNLTSLTLNEGLENISYGAFAGCIKLQTVTIPSTVTSIGHASSYVTGAFEGCSKLTTVTLRAGEDESYIGLHTFKNCVSLQSVLIPGNYSSIKANAFYGCTALTRMEYRASSSIYADQQIHENAFYGCSSMTTAVIPKTVASIGKDAFRNCTNLRSLTLNEGLQTIGQGAFAYCEMLQTVKIPSTVTLIGNRSSYVTGAFEGCIGLTRVEIKKNTNADACTLGMNAFNGCTSLSYVYIPSTYTTFSNSNIFANRGIALSIWGEWGSAAETFADANNIPFNREGLRLGIPDNIQAINRSNNIEIRWNAVQYATQYAVLRKTGTGGYKEIAKVSSNRYYDSSVSSGTIYEYTIKAMYNNMSGSYLTNGAKVTRLNMPIVRSVVNVSSGLQVTWNQVSHAKSYVIYRRTLSGSFSRIATVAAGRGVYLDTSVRNNAGAGYRYTVRALSGAPVTSVSDCRECSAIRLLTPNLKAENEAGGVKLSWNKITGASGYAVYRKTKNTAYRKIATVNSRNSVTYRDSSVKNENGSEYIYTVRAVNGNSISVGIDKKIIRVTAPSVTGLTNTASRRLVCRWSQNTKATGYQLQYATNSSFSGAKIVYLAKTGSYTLMGLSKGKRYYIRVRAVRTVNGIKYCSAWSSYSSMNISK